MNRHYLRIIVFIYLLIVTVITVIPLGGTSASLNNITVLSFRLDYLLHALVFIPMVPVWRLAFPNHPWYIIIPIAILLAILAEGTHYYLPYRAYNVNDLMGNVAGAILGIIPAVVIDGFQKRPSQKAVSKTNFITRML